MLNLWEEYKTQWVWLIRDIADHHSRLRNLSNDNWIRLYNWDKYDLVGIEHFIKKLYPELKNVIINEEELEKWMVNVKSYLKDTQYKLYLEKEDMDSIELSLMLQNWRTLTTSIISSDRFNVGDVESTWISKRANEKYIKNINIFCEKNQNQPLSATRMKAQTQVMNILAKQPNERFYNLSMPTGYGKTITALKMANWFVEKQNFKKIVYVAPYLSILEQTSETIGKAMDEKPLEHHSLAIIDKDDDQRVGENQLWMESWAHSIICTSFNQFSKAIFPRRAQDTLRRAFLKDCIVIIDEPQIFNPGVWNLFLCGLEGLSNLLNLKIIFVSATMPPFDYGLTKTPVNLNIAPMHQKERYKLYIDDDIESETTLANRIKNNKVKSQAAILNTIEDAYRVYEALNMDEAYLLHGLIIPIHKKYIIEKMKHDLKEGKDPLYLISTQVIEAGVDISFQNIFRALPILPSIIQAAGRLNRHNEGEEGSIYTFPFYRFLKQDTRRYIYPKELINITDNLINKKIFCEMN